MDTRKWQDTMQPYSGRLTLPLCTRTCLLLCLLLQRVTLLLLVRVIKPGAGQSCSESDRCVSKQYRIWIDVKKRKLNIWPGDMCNMYGDRAAGYGTWDRAAGMVQAMIQD